MIGLEGKNALITGARSGIGQAIAIKLAQLGCNIAINDRKNPEAAADTEEMALQKACGNIENSGVKWLLVQGAVSQESDIVKMVNTLVKEFSSVDILVNNAGIKTESPSHKVTTADVDRVIAVNLRGADLCARETIKHLLSLNLPGVIVNISNVHEIIPRPMYISYSISKGGMENLTKTLALEYANRGIRVNAIGPGATITRMNQNWIDEDRKKGDCGKSHPNGACWRLRGDGSRSSFFSFG